MLYSTVARGISLMSILCASCAVVHIVAPVIVAAFDNTCGCCTGLPVCAFVGFTDALWLALYCWYVPMPRYVLCEHVVHKVGVSRRMCALQRLRGRHCTLRGAFSPARCLCWKAELEAYVAVALFVVVDGFALYSCPSCVLAWESVFESRRNSADVIANVGFVAPCTLGEVLVPRSLLWKLWRGVQRWCTCVLDRLSIIGFLVYAKNSNIIMLLGLIGVMLNGCVLTCSGRFD